MHGLAKRTEELCVDEVEQEDLENAFWHSAGHMQSRERSRNWIWLLGPPFPWETMILAQSSRKGLLAQCRSPPTTGHMVGYEISPLHSLMIGRPM